MAENNKTGQGQDQRPRTAQGDVGKAHKPGGSEKPSGTNVSNPGGREIGGDPNKNKMSPDVGQDRNRQNQGNQGNQTNQGGRGPGQGGPGTSNPGKTAPDKDRVSQDIDDDDDRAPQGTPRPNLDRDAPK